MSRSVASRKTMIDLGRERRREAENAGVGAGVDDQHDKDGGHRLAHRRGERREAWRAHDPLPVALALSRRTAPPLRRAASRRAHQADAGEPLGGEAPPAHRVRRRGRGNAGGCRRVSARRPMASGGTTMRLSRVRRTEMLARMNSVVASRNRFWNSVTMRGGDDALGLVGLVDERGDQQAGPGAVEEAEIELQQVVEELAAQARDQAFLHPGSDLRRDVLRDVLEQQAQRRAPRPGARPPGRASCSPGAARRCPVSQRSSWVAPGAQRAGGAEQVLEQRHQQDDA